MSIEFQCVIRICVVQEVKERQKREIKQGKEGMRGKEILFFCRYDGNGRLTELRQTERKRGSARSRGLPRRSCTSVRSDLGRRCQQLPTALIADLRH